MTKRLCIAARTCLLAVFVTTGTAWAQEGTAQRLGSFLDALNRGLTYIGEKSEGLIAPKLGPLSEYRVDPFSGLAKVSRAVDANYPCRPDASIAITNEFGAVRVTTWDNPVVQVRAEISVGAKDADSANRTLGTVEPNVTSTPENVEIRTRVPDGSLTGNTVVEVTYTLTVPRGAKLSCQNTFGDTSVENLAGSLTLDSWYGAVALHNISGPVTVRAQGEFPLTAQGLAQGGVFTLRDTQAEFTGVTGTLTVSNLRGALTLRDPGPELAADLTNQSGAIHVYIPDQPVVDIEASAAFGDVQSDLPVSKTVQGPLTVARQTTPDAKRRLRLHTSFETVYVHREGAAPAPSAAAPNADAGLYDRVIELSSPLTASTSVLMTAIAGTIRVEGADTDRIVVKARPMVRMTSSDNVRAALEALSASLTPKEDGMHVITEVRDDMAALGCTYYRVDVTVQCPRETRLTIHAQSGQTTVSGMGEAVNIEQAEGSVAVESSKSALTIVNRKGKVDITDCAGPVKAQVIQGTLSTRTVYGRQELECDQGKTIVDAPQGEVWLRQRGGDARVIALEGIRGGYDIAVEQGSLRLLAGPSSDAAFVINAENGEVHPRALSLQGSIGDGASRFQGKMNNGRFPVTLATKNGDIFID